MEATFQFAYFGPKPHEVKVRAVIVTKKQWARDPRFHDREWSVCSGFWGILSRHVVALQFSIEPSGQNCDSPEECDRLKREGREELLAELGMDPALADAPREKRSRTATRTEEKSPRKPATDPVPQPVVPTIPVKDWRKILADRWLD